MTRQRKRPLKLNHNNVVGVVDSFSAWRLALEIEPEALDAVELRLDCLGRFPSKTSIARLKLPWIATVRHSSEGGNGNLEPAARRKLFGEAIPIADAVDLELAGVGDHTDVLNEVRNAGVPLILSAHDFTDGFSLPKLRDLARRAEDSGAAVFKVAVTPTRLSQIAALIRLLERPGLPISAMVMGPLGRPARLLLAACGSVLNYGWIEKPVVPGQWEARELRRQLNAAAGEPSAGQ